MMYRHAIPILFAFISLLQSNIAHAAVFNYAGTGDWSDTTTGWSPTSIPLLTDELWMNTANSAVKIPADYTARVDKLVIGRHALNTDLIVDGGSLLVGSGGKDVLFVGQYSDAEGTVTLYNDACVNVEGELAVSVSGPGTWIQHSGTVTVRDRFVIGRYGNVEAVGDVKLYGGTITASRFDMNVHSTLRLQGGLLQLHGNHLSKVQGHIDGGRITGSGTPKLVYDAEEDITSLWISSVINYNGAGDWSDPSVWPSAKVPAYYDEVWMNVADKSLAIPPDNTARIDTLVIGRHVLNTQLNINGGTLLVGSGDNDVFFVGQYEASHGTVNLNSGSVEVQGELAVSVSGAGTWLQEGGSVFVHDRFVIGRYNKVEAIGDVILRAGSIVASKFDMNTYSTLKLEGGILALNGNHASKVQGHIDAGRIFATAGLNPHLVYDDISGRTYVYADTAIHYTNYYGVSAPPMRMLRSRSLVSTTSTEHFPSWFDPEAWQPNGIPGPGSEVWMNSGDTSAFIGLNEVATANKLILGRHQGLVTLAIDGGELLVDHDGSNSAILFLGQYQPNGNAKIILKNGRIKVNGEFAVGVSGTGTMDVLGGRIDVTGWRMAVGRYSGGIGNVLLNGGDIHVNRLDINSLSKIDLQEGRLYITGDDTNKMNNYVNGGQLQSYGTNTVTVHYDGAAGVTIVEGAATPNPTNEPTSEPTNPPSSAPSQQPTKSPIVTPKPTTAPSLSPVTPAPTPSPSASPAIYISPEDWDIKNILLFAPEKVGPKRPELNRNSLNIRQFTPVPDYGVHPRIFFGPNEIDGVRNSLENTAVGQAAYSGAKQIISLLVYGRNSCGGECYNDFAADEKNLPNGKQKISNAGLYHTNPTYEDLISGSCTIVESQGGTHTNVLGGGMAIEAFDLLIFPEQSDASTRKANLASAMANWADCVLANPSFGADGAHGSAASRDLFGGQHLAFAYDLAFNFMSSDQQAKVRKAVAEMIWLPEQFAGIETEPYATTSNWVTINSFVPAMIMAIEGETTKSVDGWGTSELEVYFDQIMQANYKFLTYGYYEEGAGYEGSGKNYQYNAMMPAYAKRGYNFFTHPHVQAYGTEFLPSLLQPYGHYITSYDTIGGSGLDPEWGGQKYHSIDIIGLKWAYPDDAAIDFIYRQFMETPYKASDGTKQVFLDVYEQKITPRSTYQNSFLANLIMPSDYGTGDFAFMSAAAHKDFTFYGKERGLVITRSGFEEEDLAMNFHVRQDTGGHTYGDRLSFTLSGLGRSFVRNPVGYVPETEWSSGILVDGQGITIAPQDGRKARMPSRLVNFYENSLSTFTLGDATYSYNTAWKWCRCRPVGSDVGIGGWDPVLETWNDFRGPTNQITEFYGDVPFVDYGNWLVPGYTEGIHKQQVNDLSQVYRQAGLIRGQYPYALIVDDLHKLTNSANTEWQWLAQLPQDLSLVPASDFSDANLDPARDVVFKEPDSTGSRKLLVRILNADGSQPEGLAEHKEFAGNLSGGLSAWRLIIRRVAERPRFRIMLYPFEDGQPIPAYSVSNTDATLEWSSNLKDTIKFHPSTQSVGGVDVEITGIEITRSGNVKVVDTRDQIAVPMDIRW